MHINRRIFISKLSASAGVLSFPFSKTITRANTIATNGGCWLTVCVPFVIEDAANNIHTDIILTSASFDGIEGYNDTAYSTDYELYLYDPAGNSQPVDGSKRILRMCAPAMHATVIRCSDLLNSRQPFWGAVKIRGRAKGSDLAFVGDLFSAAFVRWDYADSFDTLHAHPDPLQLQTPDKFYSSMPFPSLEEYAATLCLFNPYETSSIGRIIVHTREGQKHVEQSYKLTPYSSVLFNLNTGSLSSDIESVFDRGAKVPAAMNRGGSIVIENDETTVKNFSYMLIKGKANNAFAAEHTIHQGNYPVKRATSPFAADQSFRAQGWLYSAFVFHDKTIGGLNMTSRIYLSAGRPLEDEIWLMAYVADAEGKARWTTKDDKLAHLLPPGFFSKSAVRMRPFQSCSFDFAKLSLESDFAGGIGIATSLKTSHVLMKVEVCVSNWGTSAFSHFRPGSRSARALQGIKSRGGLVSDYIVSGARMKRTDASPEADCLIGVFNMEEDKVGSPVIEVFAADGFITKKSLGQVRGIACKHFLLSDIFPELSRRGAGPLTLRLIDGNAAVIMSALHIDYKRRDVAIDHGSDRFSTYIDYPCQ